jgi:hypothetical protein
MLGKLVKYEFKATSRILIPLYIVLLFMSIINRFAFFMDDSNIVMKVVKPILIATYVLFIVATLAVTIFFMIIRFYKNYFSDEGYLMFTLPSKTHELIVSKLILTLFWIVISLAVIFLSVFIISPSENWPTIIFEFKQLIANMQKQFGSNYVLVSIEFIMMILLGGTLNILMVYTSIAVGQMISKYRIIGSFVAYAIIYTGMQILLLIVLAVVSLIFKENITTFLESPQAVFPAVLVVLAIASSGFFFTTNNIFKRRLNLE